MKGLETSFLHFAQKKALFKPDHRILLAVSGGIDSMVMTEMFRRLDQPVLMAHCNFMLRGEESDQDEEFVRRYAGDNDIPVFIERFDTITFAEEHRLSIQMSARKLRYDWFNKLLRENDLDAVAVAHNLDDLAETVLINLSRGTGLKGITGIQAKHHNIIRPLLFASRQEIETWASNHHIAYREDSSNRSVKYIRNKIRHEIIPLFREINPNFLQSIAQTTDRLMGIEQLFTHYVRNNLNGLMQKFGDRHIIPIKKLKETEATEAVLFELLRPFHFPPALTFEIMEALDSEPGKKFFSPSYRLIKDRDHLIITPLPKKKKQEKYYIEEGSKEIVTPVILQFNVLNRSDDFRIPENQDTAVLDMDKLVFPLILRTWRDGDWFIPLGLGGIKKISDFFIDRKLSLDEKENVWLLTQGDEIVWVVGMQIDDRFKITPGTERILRIDYQP